MVGVVAGRDLSSLSDVLGVRTVAVGVVFLVVDPYVVSLAIR